MVLARILVVLMSSLAVAGCGDSGGGGFDTDRTVFVEVTSSPSGLLMSVSVGLMAPPVSRRGRPSLEMFALARHERRPRREACHDVPHGLWQAALRDVE
jgi:hypothetical protein